MPSHNGNRYSYFAPLEQKIAKHYDDMKASFRVEKKLVHGQMISVKVYPPTHSLGVLPRDNKDFSGLRHTPRRKKVDTKA